MAEAAKTAMSFKEVCNLLKDGSDEAVVDAVDRLLGLGVVLSPIVAGPPALPLLALIGPKNELIKVAKSALKKRDSSFLERCGRMAAAYTLSVYSAFFMALDEALPHIAEMLDLSGSEKISLAHQGDDPEGANHTETKFPLPTAAGLDNDDRRLRANLYTSMSKALLKFASGLEAWDELAPHERITLTSQIEGLPKQAEEAFWGQYVSLSAEFPEFAAWVRVKDQARLEEKFDAVRQHLTAAQVLLTRSHEDLDIGLNRLGELIASLAQFDASEASKLVADNLHTRYENAISDPVIRDDDRDETSDVVYPSKQDAFVPQSFRFLRYERAKHALESENLWASQTKTHDISQFIVQYLQSPYSLEAPMLILGQPGSGKSLLTQMLAARLKPPYYFPVRIELRDINPEDSIQIQIEKQIKDKIGRDVDWVRFSEGLAPNPPLVILDGFDELLQSNGRVFSNYLEKVQTFQIRELELNRPVRVIVTSRLTLIDRARVPNGAIVMRLLEFDLERQHQWINTWNRTNASYFEANQVQPFALPTQEKLQPLAVQPLLLLMLALYDSQGNALSQFTDLDQTALYYNLLHRFIEREKTKGKDADVFAALDAKERAFIIESEFEKLGITAMGMFCRESVHITRPELERDLAFFNARKSAPQDESLVPLAESDIVLGGFFFIHEASSQQHDADRSSAAFEFLHNTFGEFLTADFTLRLLSRKISTIAALKQSPQLSALLMSELTSIPDELVACLSHTSLHSRPVILAMIREWAQNSDNGSSVRLDETFLECLNEFVASILHQFTDGTELPRVVDSSDFGDLPAMGRIALLTLNLVLLRAVLDRAGIEFPTVEASGKGSSSWTRLTSLWRGWFTAEELASMNAVIASVTTPEAVVVRAKDVFQADPTRTRLELIMSAAQVLADDALTGLAQLVAFETWPIESELLESADRRLRMTGIELPVLFAVRKSWSGRFDDEMLSALLARHPDDRIGPPISTVTSHALLDFARRSLNGEMKVRPHLGTSQLRHLSWESDTALRALLELNSEVEPRFVPYATEFITDQTPSSIVASKLIDTVLAFLVENKYLRGVAPLLEALEPVLSQLSFPAVLSVAVLADRFGYADICDACLKHVEEITDSGLVVFGAAPLKILVSFARLLEAQDQRGVVVKCRRAFVAFVTSLAMATYDAEDMVREGPPRPLAEAALRLMGAVEYQRSILRRVVRVDLYAVTAEEFSRLAELFYRRDDKESALALLESMEMSKSRNRGGHRTTSRKLRRKNSTEESVRDLLNGWNGVLGEARDHSYLDWLVGLASRA